MVSSTFLRVSLRWRTLKVQWVSIFMTIMLNSPLGILLTSVLFSSPWSYPSFLGDIILNFVCFSVLGKSAMPPALKVVALKRRGLKKKKKKKEGEVLQYSVVWCPLFTRTSCFRAVSCVCVTLMFGLHCFCLQSTVALCSEQGLVPVLLESQFWATLGLA